MPGFQHIRDLLRSAGQELTRHLSTGEIAEGAAAIRGRLDHALHDPLHRLTIEGLERSVRIDGAEIDTERAAQVGQ